VNDALIDEAITRQLRIAGSSNGVAQCESIYIFIHRSSRRKHASKKTTRKTENKQRKIGLLIKQAIKLSNM